MTDVSVTSAVTLGVGRMLAERYHGVAADLVQGAQATNLRRKLQGIKASLEQLQRVRASSDAEPSNIRKAQGALREALAEADEALAQSPANRMAPSEARILKQIGGWELTGDRIRESISKIFDAPVTEAAGTLDRLSMLLERRNEFYSALESVTDSFSYFNIEQGAPPSDGAEVGASFIYLEMGQTTLEEIAVELEELETHLRWFAEVVGVTPGQIRVQAVGSSELEIFLKSPYGQAAAIGIALQALVGILNGAADLALKYEELQDFGTPQEIPEEQVEEIVDEYIDREREKVKENLLKKYDGDPGRQNEIEQGLGKSLQYLLNRMSEGAEFEVRVLKPSEAEEDDEIGPGLGTVEELQRRGRAMMEDEGRGRGLPVKKPELLEAGPDESDDSPDEEQEDGQEDSGADDPEGVEEGGRSD